MLPKSISKLKSTGRLLPIMSGIGLLAISYLLISPVGTGGENASAWVYGGTGGSSNGSTISLTSSKSSISNTASSINNTISDTTNLTVTASGTSQYAIYVQETQNEGKLVNGSSALTQLSAERGYNDIDAGKWGYALAEGSGVNASGLTYKAVPSASTTAAYTGTTADSKPFTLAFAAKFADGNPAGHYTGQVLVSVAANPGEVTNGFGGIEYMDELTPDICKAAKENDTAQLIDWRDRKSYWVAKLKDGNCWMTQNLDYDDPNSTRITSTSGSNGGPGANWKSDNTTRQYWDPGKKVVSGSTLAAATETTDEHLLVGNYYSYVTATAGTGAGITNDGGNAINSICPGGWKLPISKVATSGSFGGLTDGISASSTLVTNPYYFQYGGYVGSGNLQEVGSVGRYWSSTVISNTTAYILYFNSGNNVNPSTNDYRYNGLPVRCLVQPTFEPAKNLEAATYMQEVTSETCSKTTTLEQQKQLVDYRDGKTYYVSKLKDGNCWMTQNLDYDDPGTPAANRFTKETGVSGWTSTAADYRAYFDPGDYYFNDPTSWNQCNPTSVGLSQCGAWTTSGDKHYHAGNYYSWAAADSVCPANWQLPSSNSSTVNGSFGKLMSSYGIGNDSSSATKARKTPLYFLTSGFEWSGKDLSYAGSMGLYWSSTAGSANNAAYLLELAQSGAKPSTNTSNDRYYRYDGLSVRCLILGS